MARCTPADSAAPVRQQGHSLVPQPMPEDSVQRGLLRDLWRASSRFIEGRWRCSSGRWRRAESALPNDLDEITVVTGGRREFTRQVFATLAGEGHHRSSVVSCLAGRRRRSTAASASTTRRAAHRHAGGCSASG
ncbi:MAG: hypothetical protein IPG81_27590 [Sandaracinaceae bacterium]|nr:hypothetical protein [Sandaracinaceae bacterium]